MATIYVQHHLWDNLNVTIIHPGGGRMTRNWLPPNVVHPFANVYAVEHAIVAFSNNGNMWIHLGTVSPGGGVYEITQNHPVPAPATVAEMQGRESTGGVAELPQHATYQ